MAQSGCPGRRGGYDERAGDGAGGGDFTANIYLHYVFDLWAARWRRREATGDMVIVRYADDIVVGFEHEADGRRFLDMMRERLAEFALTLHPEKTRLIAFGRFGCGSTCQARARQTGNVRLPWLYTHLRTDPAGAGPNPSHKPEGPPMGDVAGGQGNT